ncbi:MAG: GrpB family protein [Clostridiales bacterium]|nr:GrpB family protein [Clostridiales bacterium]
MKKRLSEMTLEELWALFPIILTQHDPAWTEWYQEKEALLQNILPKAEVLRISHIGSTAIPAIWAKPIVDILVEVKKDCNLADIQKILTENGFICMSREENRMSFNMGYTEDGFAEKVFHLHLRKAGDHKELYFRDYLINHPDIAKEYEKMKLGLWKEYEHHRDGYTQAKSTFIAHYTALAQKEYENRYE